MDFWLERALREIDGATQGIPPDAMCVPPAPGKWSVAQILGHLSLAFRGTVGGLSKVLQSGKPIATQATLKQRLFTRVVVGLGYFPSGRPAPTFTVPADVSAQALPAIREDLLAMDASLRDVEQKFGSAVKVVNHPVLGPFTVREWRKFHYIHTRHHMKQVRNLRERLAAEETVG